MNCEEFKNKSVKDRKLFVIKENLCFNCLSKKHQVKDCNSDFTCRKSNCKQKHHKHLHDETQNAREEANINHATQITHNKTFLEVLPITTSNGDLSVSVNALFDSGSDSSLITRNTVDKLKLQGQIKSHAVSNEISTNKTLNKTLNRLVFMYPQSHTLS